MSLTAQPPADKPQGNIRRTGSWLKQGWEHVQVRLGSMVLSDVPLVLIGTVLVLTAFGVIMVLSASSVEQISAGLVPYAQARSQAIFAVLGFALMLLIGFGIPVWFYRKPWVLYTALGICVGLLLTVIFFGVSVGGNRNWIELPGFNLQPSEVAKPVTILWLAMVFSRQGAIDRGSAAQTLYKALIPSALGVGVVLALILAGHDLGTVLIYALFFVTMLLAAKPSRSTIIVALGALALAAFFFVITSPNRIERIINTLAFWRECAEATCDQANSGLAALATGGFWGVGLGQSRQKYNYLPEAHNDYIFAVIGEELGMLGGLTVLFLYAALIYCCMRILLRSSDLFVRFATIGMMTWLVGQAMLNIAMVVGMMPVIGVPLPFVSYGGSSLISSLIGVGFLIGFARQTPLQPIVGQSVVGANSTVQKDAARRYKLGRIVAAEQARIARNPYDAGWTLEKFKQRFWPESALLAPGAEPSSTRTGQRPSPSDATVHSAATNKRSAAAQGQVPQRTAQQPGTRAPQRQQPTSAPVAGHKPSAQRSQPVAQETERQAEQRKLPTGLRTIRQARQLPKRPTNEP